MAKDVNLSSKEWLDIVFDGKNKDFGAYQMRAATEKRHTKAVIIVLCILIAIMVALVLAISGVFTPSEEDTTTGVEQQDMSLYNPDDEIEEDDTPEVIEIPEEKPEVIKEEVANSIQNTVIDIVEDDKVVNEVKNKEELLEDNRAMGAMDVSDGIDDLTKQTVKEEVVIVEQKEEKPKEDNIIYNTANVQQQPEFPGGEAAMYKWLSEHIQYPAAAAEEGVSGRVTVQFIVSKTGAIENVEVVRGRHPALDKEAIRVVKSMPKWNPGRNNGQAVKVTYILPVTFKLQQ